MRTEHHIKLCLLFLFAISFIENFSQTISKKTTLLNEQVNALTYVNNYDSAQVLVFTFLKEKYLSEDEIFYGEFLLADILKASGNAPEAIYHLQQNLEGLSENKDDFKSLILGNISECYFNMLNYPEAKKYALLSISKNPEKSIRKDGHAINHLIIGYNDFINSNYTSALDHYQFAINEYNDHNSICELPLCYLKIAKVYHQLKDKKKRDNYLEKSLLLSDSCNIILYKLQTKRTLFEFLQSEEKFEGALNTLQEINTLVEELHNKKQDFLIKEIAVKYETIITQDENNILKEKAKNTQLRYNTLLYFFIALGIILLLLIIIITRRRKNINILQSHFNLIEKQNTEREILLKEIHHRVKNNLQVITSLLGLQSSYIEDEKTKESFRNGQSRIKSMAMVHEMLYQSDSLSEIYLQDYIDQLLFELVKSFKEKTELVQVDIEANDIYLNVDTSISLGLLINEIITNSLKYGFEEKGKIYVKVTPIGENSFKMTIGDNGSGYNDDLDIKKLKSLGLKLIHNLVKQLKGTIKKSTKKQGTHYTITFNMIGVLIK